MANTIKEYRPQTVSHPGLTLAEKLDEIGMGNKEFSVRVNKPEKTITAVTKGNSSITADMAVKFEDVLSIPATFWLKRQRVFDEYQAREKRNSEIEAAVEWAKGFPYPKMASLGWLPPTRKAEEKVVNLFAFFGVSSKTAWESYYFDQKLKINFRISLAHTNEALAVSAWLRKGELEAQELTAPKYDSKLLKHNIFKFRNLMVNQTDTFFIDLQRICLEAGVKVLYTPCLPKAPIHGSTRWIGDSPLIQLSARYKTNDKFWFTFFHELGHILLHGKKYISIENIQYGDIDLEKEKEADEFAIENTFSNEQEAEVLQLISLSPEDVIRFAEKFYTHPAMIIGRLQKKGLIHYSVGREFIQSIDLETNGNMR